MVEEHPRRLISEKTKVCDVALKLIKHAYTYKIQSPKGIIFYTGSLDYFVNLTF